MQKKLVLLFFLILLNSHNARANDPYQPFNRDMETVNTSLDKNIVKPITEGYVTITTSPVRSTVSNFVNNLQEPVTIINDLLQGKIEQSIQDSARFIFNCTFGLFGLIDIATPMGLERHDEDFGQTFAVWGWSDSDYLELPLLGPSTVRDATGKPLSLMIASYNIPYTIARILTIRESLMAVDPMIEASSDRYIFIRDGYLQQRTYLINDGRSDAKEKFKGFDFSD